MAGDEPLETGYGPERPLRDNLCNDFPRETARSFAELGRPIYERLGFVAMARVSHWLGLR
jgi:hypothetical protein